jgi:AbiU2
MTWSKILKDIVGSATAAKAHFEVYWAQVSEAKLLYLQSMDRHSDFFRASIDAHFTSSFVYLGHLYDENKDASSIASYLKEIKATSDDTEFKLLGREYDVLAARAKPLVVVRHKAVAHINKALTEADVYGSAGMTWNEIRSVFYDSAKFVGKLAGERFPGEIGIPCDRRLIESTLRLIAALPENDSNATT